MTCYFTFFSSQSCIRSQFVLIDWHLIVPGKSPLMMKGKKHHILLFSRDFSLIDFSSISLLPFCLSS